MSWVRWGIDSSVYIFDHTDLGPVCFACLLLERHNGNDRHYATTEADDMIAHLAEHRRAGHVVPDWLPQHLRDTWDREQSG
jgi:hypothetical protein